MPVLASTVVLALPHSAATEPLTGPVAMYRDRAHQARLVVPSPQFDLGAEESVHPSFQPAFEAQWTGPLSVLQAGAYRFEAGPAQVVVDGRPVTGAVSLATGRHPITIRYRRQLGVAQLRVQRQSERFPLEPVPSRALFDEPAETGALVERGRLLAEEYGCANCHRGASPSLRRRPGPELTGFGSRAEGR